MDIATLILALCVTVAVVGQLLLIVWGNHYRQVDERQLAEARARLLEDAADRQALATFSHTAKLDENKKGLSGD